MNILQPPTPNPSQKRHSLTPLLVLAAISAYFIIHTHSFPYLGISIALSIISTTIFYYQTKTNTSKITYASNILANIFIVYRSHPLLTILNILTSIYTLALLTNQSLIAKNLYNLIFSPLYTLGKTLDARSKFEFPKSLNKNFLTEHTTGIIVAILTSIIIVPLLASTNPIFKELTNNIFNIEKLLENNVTIILRITTFLTLSILIPKAISSIISPNTHFKWQVNTLPKFNLLLSKLTTSIILTTFFITQYQLHFQSTQAINNLQTTNSKVTNEIFIQLSIVAIIVFLLIYHDSTRNKLNKIFTHILALQAILLEYIALQSLINYTSRHGLTHERIFGYTLLAWILGIIIITLYQYITKKSHQHTAFPVTILTLTTVFTLNAVNPDTLILNNPPHLVSYSRNSHEDYLTYNMFYDTTYHAQTLQQITHNVTYIEAPDVDKANQLIYRLKQIQNKYKNTNIHGFNYAEHQTYKQTSHIQLEELYNQLRNYQESHQWQSQNYQTFEIPQHLTEK